MSSVTNDQLQDLINQVVPPTAGSIPFVDNDGIFFAEDNDGIYFDKTNVRLGIGLASPTGKAHINQGSTTGAIPSIHLEQDDVSEEIMRFTGSATTGVLTQTLVAGASVTTATKAGFIRVNVQDEGNVMTDGNYYIQVYTIT